MLGFGALGELALGEAPPASPSYAVHSVEIGIIDTSTPAASPLVPAE